MNQSKWYKFLISEITTLPKEFYKIIEEELISSNFWLKPHTDNDISFKKSPLTREVESALNTAFTKLGKDDVEVKVITAKGSKRSEDTTSYFGGASHSVAHGKHYIELEIIPFPNLPWAAEIGRDIHRSLIKEIAESLRHELIHAGQLDKQSTRKNISLTKAEQERASDKYQTPQASPSDPREPEIYQSRKIEIEAHAHQTAEYLLGRYNQAQIQKIITQPIDEMPFDVVKYSGIWRLKNNPTALKRFRNRLYAYIQHLTEK